MGSSLLLRPVRMPSKRTSWPPGRRQQEGRMLTEEPGLPDYPSQFLLEDNNRILLEQ